jgi:dolichol-phosphate mannosyltransferase
MGAAQRGLNRYLVVLPTHNERDNIETIVSRVLAASPLVDVMVVDHGSTDGTASVAASMAKSNPRVSVHLSASKEGLAKAYLTGMRYGLGNGYAAVCTMDADGQHDPQDIPALLDGLEHGDLVIGSRYCVGAGPHQWAFGREFFSAIANTVAKVVVGDGVRDVTSGYRAYRSELLARLPLDLIGAQGYAGLVELLFESASLRARIVETPIRFERRLAGNSKIGLNEIFEFLSTAMRLRRSRPQLRRLRLKSSRSVTQ